MLSDRSTRGGSPGVAETPLRIAHVVPTYYPATRYGGPIVSTRTTCAELVRRGHRVQVFTTNVDGPGVLDVPVALPQDVDGAEVRYYPARVAGSVYFSPALGRALSAGLDDVDIVHIHSVFTWTTAAAAFHAARARVPYLVAPRGALVPRYIRDKSRLPKTAWLQLLGRPIFAGAARLHVTTEAEYTDASQVGVRLPRPLVVPNGVDAPLPESLEPMTRSLAEALPERPYVLFLGRVDLVKRIELVLEALVDTEMCLVIAGGGTRDYRESLQRMAQRLGVAGRVAFVGPVLGADKWALLRAARALVLPSLHENFGNVVVEAMAMGRPVVVTPGVGTAEIVRRTGAGAVVEPTPGGLRAALCRFFNDRPAAERAGRAGRDYIIRALTIEATTETLLAGYREVLG